MANELSVNTQSGNTVYCVIRRRSDAYVWAPGSAAFVVWNNSAIASYPISLTDAGGDLYQADMPAAMPANTDLDVIYYLQAGGSPVITDLILLSEQITWTGSSVASSSTVVLSASALTTLDSVKRNMRINNSASDTLLTELINQVSKKIQTLCNRDIVAGNYVQWFDGNEQHRLTVRNWPIISMNRLAYGNATSFTVSYAGSDIMATAGWAATNALRLWSMNANGTETTNNLLFSSYQTASKLVTAINLISGWSATLLLDCPARHLRPMGQVNALTRMLSVSYPNLDIWEYDFWPEAGTFSLRAWSSMLISQGRDSWYQELTPRMPAGRRYIMAEYRGGYEVVPDDIARVANELVATAYRVGIRDLNVKSENLGDYAYTLADQTQISEAQMAMLRPYMTLR